MMRLPRADGLVVDVPPRDPERCETCRTRRAALDGYCSGLCRLFDEAIAELRDAYHRADCARDDPEVVARRTWLRAVAEVFDVARLGARPLAGARDWREDVEAGRIEDVDRDAMLAAVRRHAETLAG